MSKRILPPAPTVPLELWRALYRAATEFQVLAPWRWMDDTHVLGINSHENVRLVSVMGNLGEVFGLASYRGSTGVNFLLRLLRGEFAPETSDALFHQDALLADFASGKELRQSDRLVMQQLGFSPAPSKPRLFPKFSSHKPGFLPWFIDESEASLLLEDLQKTTLFAKLVQETPNLFESRKPDEFPFYPNRASDPLTLNMLEWHTVAPTPLPADPQVVLAATDHNALLKTSLSAGTVWELSAFYSRDPISEPPRPYYPKLALTVDARSGMVLAFQLGSPHDTMAKVAAECLKQAVVTAGCRPSQIQVDSANLFHALAALAERLVIKLAKVKRLPMTKEARDSLEAHNRQR